MWPLTRILNLGMVPLRGDCTLEGEKRFNGTTRIVAVLSGPRRNVLTKDDPSVSDSFAFITTDGPFEIPATAGVHYWIELGGDHDITFDGKQLDISDENWGTGDLLFVQVKSATSIRILRFAAADVVDESDFAGPQ